MKGQQPPEKEKFPSGAAESILFIAYLPPLVKAFLTNGRGCGQTNQTGQKFAPCSFAGPDWLQGPADGPFCGMFKSGTQTLITPKGREAFRLLYLKA